MEESFPRDSGGTAAPPDTPHGGGAVLLSQATAVPRYPQAGRCALPRARALPAIRWWALGWGRAWGPQGAHTHHSSLSFFSEKLKEQAEKDKGKREEWRALRPHLRLGEGGAGASRRVGQTPGPWAQCRGAAEDCASALPASEPASPAHPARSGPQNARGPSLCTLGK